MIARWIFVLVLAPCSAAALESIKVHITGRVAAVTAGEGAVILESTRRPDGLALTVEAPARETPRLEKVHVLWKDLIAAADPDTARRLSNDAAMYPGSPRLYIQTNSDGTRGFAVTIDQIKRERTIRVPSLDIVISAGDPLPATQGHRRVLDEVRSQPEATYRDFTSRWEDMGNPGYRNPGQMGPGHTICLAWDSSMRKFGIDRWGGVRNDLGTPEPFQFAFDIGGTWKSQSLLDGLPIVTTVFERDGVRFELEQFAYPLDGPPRTRRGDIDMVLLAKLRATSLDGKPRRVPIRMHRRTKSDPAAVALDLDGQTLGGSFEKTIEIEVPANGAREIVAKPAAIPYAKARQETIRFWTTWLDRGAVFRVPEKVVNDLYRANLWHALRLPRRHGEEAVAGIDLPYSNFAYGQKGTPWPVNQSVYVDYMLYGLRGHFDVAREEMEVQYRNNQEPNGHVRGFANWLVYTPGMLYATAQLYFLSGDRALLDALLPQSLKALDWCLGQLRTADGGLVAGPLNDLTHDGTWAFNQAYMYAGLEEFGRVLESIGHPKGVEARVAARRLAAAIDRGFRLTSAKSPLVQLRDGSWIPYVPCEVNTPGRMLDIWYPTDVDTGGTHLLRLKAVPATGDLAESILNDHEDNLYYKGWGMANEPVYVQQATAYLLRDDVPAVVRAFYSYMASAFSHSALEPVEHRWTHGQYFGPPSTDGAWFELYRNMLIQERDDGSLLLAGFTPRPWLQSGERIEVARAPSRFGRISFTIESRASTGEIEARVEMPDRTTPSSLFVRLRHPSGSRMRAVSVNGGKWNRFNPDKEWVEINAPFQKTYKIVADFARP